ncbi:1-acylglycerol-3-phosphate O-acyltransferase [Entophlyctis sp. JEL0112]|nr:1-acylglycerol-3-phosphate O-acyltransferase [Entophlyctis sp. JEL0112]
MAKSDFLYIPFMGQFLYLANNIFIDRENAKSASKTMKYVASELKRKNMGIFMYPEGTRSNQTDNSLLPFKQVCTLVLPGAFRLAIEGQMPIIPIVISTYGDVCNMKTMVFKGGKVQVKGSYSMVVSVRSNEFYKVLPPISTEGKSETDIVPLMRHVRGKMLDTLQEISEANKIKSKL